MSESRPDDPAPGDGVHPGSDETPPSGVTDPGAASPASGDASYDADRRRFFRSFGRDAMHTAVTVVGLATALQQTLPNATGQLLGLAEPAAGAGPADTTGRPAGAEPPGFRSPCRYRAGALDLVDQSRLPDELVVVTCRSGAEVAAAIRMGTVRGGPVLGQVAAYGLALAAERVRSATPFVRSATLHGTLNALRSARPSSRAIEWSLARMQRRLEAVGEMSEDGDLVAGALRSEAEEIDAGALTDHAALGRFGAAVLAGPSEGRLEVVVHGFVGPLAGGAAGTALAVVQSRASDERPVRVWLPEGRPWLQGSRVTAWELAQSGIDHAVVADAACGWLLSRSRIDAVLVGAERIARNGDVAATVGTYPLALLATRHRIPVYVCSPLAALDPAVADGWQIGAEERSPSEVTEPFGRRVAPVGTPAYNPVLDVTPHDLITGFVTEEGLLEPPFDVSLLAAYEAREARRPAIAGEAS